ncbi:MAG: hypothetical protein V1663_04330 [archaeon]
MAAFLFSTNPFASFVQSLPYTSDKVTTSFDEYPRFPYENLYDGGGDCEDTSILTSALLSDMGYGVVLIKLPEHIAVGVLCQEDVLGYYYLYEGRKYCYLETTGENWDVGMLPDEYKNVGVEIIPVYSRPYLNVDFTYDIKDYNYALTYVDVEVNVNNLGSEKAENVKIYTALQTTDTSKVYSPIESDLIDILPEAGYKYTVQNLVAPTGKNFRVYVRAYGDNVISDEKYSGWITWN